MDVGERNMGLDKPFWEKSYSKTESISPFNRGMPSWDVIEVLAKYISKGKVLDLGCGDGRNAIYAASLGYDVTAIDISKAGISILNNHASEKGLDIKASIQDIRNFSSDEVYDAIISHGCLHLILRHEWIDVLSNIQALTAPNGFNIVVVFTDKIPPSADMEPFIKGLFKESELYDFYSNWTIHHKSNHIFEDDHDGGIHHMHAVNRIIAQKTVNL